MILTQLCIDWEKRKQLFPKSWKNIGPPCEGTEFLVIFEMNKKKYYISNMTIKKSPEEIME